MNTTLTIHELIERECLITLLQPLVSMNRKSLLGFEALTRAVNPFSGEIIPPQELFAMCEDVWTLTRLDRACRRKAFETFSPISRNNRSLLLSVNIDAAIINRKTTIYDETSRMAADAGIPCNNIILEIIESKAGNDNQLCAFVEKSRSQGFLIALDDIGTGHSNLDRIPKLKPDIIKIDRSLIKDINTKFHNQEVTRALVNLAERTGSLPLAEGIETPEEALTLLTMGIDVFQGFYFAKPMRPDEALSATLTAIKSLAARFKSHRIEQLTSKKAIENNYKNITRKLKKALTSNPPGNEYVALSNFIAETTAIECAYILDSKGIQISETICNPCRLKANRRLIYQPAPSGADHSLKEYYLTIKSGRKWHTTLPYISLASGNSCVTISTRLYDEPESPILCVDIGT